MKKNLSDVLATIAAEAVIEVFSSYGMAVQTRSEPPPPARQSIVPKSAPGDAIAVGVIGFTGDTMQGTLLLATTLDVIGEARPPEVRLRPLSKDSASDWIVARDWVGELTNQVLGRIKSRLRPYGVTFELSPPAALSGPALTFAAPKGPRPVHCTFGWKGQTIWFCLDPFLDAKRQVEELPAGDCGTGAGKVIFFE